jgi:hypothetical protein
MASMDLSPRQSLAIRVEGYVMRSRSSAGLKGLLVKDSHTEKLVVVRAIATDGSLVSWLIAVHPG